MLTDGHGWYSEPAFSPDGRVDRRHGVPPTARRMEAMPSATSSCRRGDWHGAASSRPSSIAGRSRRSGRRTAASCFPADDAGGAAIFRLDLEDERVTRLAGDGGVRRRLRSARMARRSTRSARSRTGRRTSSGSMPGPPTRRRPSSPPRRRPARELPRRGVRRARDRDRRRRRRDRLVAPAAGGGLARRQPRRSSSSSTAARSASWAGWSWRWNANLLVERGYAVLMPDPAISTGYGQAFIDRGWGRWGERPYTDVMAAVDGALERPDLDATPHGAHGRLVRRLHGQLGRRPHRPVPGDRHPRLAVGPARLPRHDRRRRGGSRSSATRTSMPRATSSSRPQPRSRTDPDADAGHPRRAGRPRPDLRGARAVDRPLAPRRRARKFLYFPDENHWILKPQNARLWYETVLAFLDQPRPGPRVGPPGPRLGAPGTPTRHRP